MLHIMSFATTGTEQWFCNTVVALVSIVLDSGTEANGSCTVICGRMVGGAVVHQSPLEKMQKWNKASGFILAF